MKIAIIGTGISGLATAHGLQNHATITCFEKARGVGGRLATRRALPYVFDHGAPYFTLKNPAIKSWLEPLFQQGVIQAWLPNNSRPSTPERQYYVGSPSMNAMAKALSRSLNIRTQTRIESMQRLENGWRLTDDKGQSHGPFNWIVCTAPVPQCLALMPQNFLHIETLKTIPMQACFSAMLGFKHPVSLASNRVQLDHPILDKIIANHHKPQRNTPTSLVLHSTNAWAEAHQNHPINWVQQQLHQALLETLTIDAATAEHQAIHRWLYANTQHHDMTHEPLIDSSLQLAIAGDWLQGGRVESAALSGFMLAEALLALT